MFIRYFLCVCARDWENIIESNDSLESVSILSIYLTSIYEKKWLRKFYENTARRVEPRKDACF